MRSIKARVRQTQNKYPLLGNYICLSRAIKGQKFTQSSITREFTKLVPKNDYAKSERRTLIKYLVKVSNGS